MSDGGHVWWEDAIVYQVYPRSFADADGDGVGDLPGLRSRLGYLADLGVDAIWLTPFYPSPLADGGYDVSDYCAVDPLLGTMADFDALVSSAAAHQIRIIVDLVPNHCSSAHPLFRAALAAAPGSPERARFFFRDGPGNGQGARNGQSGAQPPNNWPSQFGGSAWTRVTEGQWYLHLWACPRSPISRTPRARIPGSFAPRASTPAATAAGCLSPGPVPVPDSVSAERARVPARPDRGCPSPRTGAGTAWNLSSRTSTPP